MSEQELYEFCIKNVENLIKGKLSIEKIRKLREIDFSFDYYIDEYIKNEIVTIEELINGNYKTKLEDWKNRNRK
tara:strand:- start:270 stop:491 length:222 start_codon:yes stop_codon:yes gene_type:complete